MVTTNQLLNAPLLPGHRSVNRSAAGNQPIAGLGGLPAGLARSLA